MKRFVETVFVATAFAGTVFVRVVFIFSKIPWHITTESSVTLTKYLTFLQLDYKYDVFQYTRWFFGFSHSHWHFFLFHLWLELHFLSLNLHLHSQDIFFVNFFASFTPVIMLKTLTFRLYVLFGTHTLLYKSLRVLQFPTHLSKLKVH